MHQPHDKVFKTTFGNPANAAALLREQVPPGISSAIRWDELRLEPGSFVDSQFRQSESVLLFPTRLNGRDFLILIQLAELPFEKIVGTPAGILALRTLEAEQLEKLLDTEVWDEAIIRHAIPTFKLVLRYILSQTELTKPASQVWLGNSMTGN